MVPCSTRPTRACRWIRSAIDRRWRRDSSRWPAPPSDLRAARTPHQAVAAALASPLLMSALPLRVASFALQGPERGRVQILIHADVGSDYSSSKVASVAYMIGDQNGKLVDNRAFDMRLLPIMSGVHSALQSS